MGEHDSIYPPRTVVQETYPDLPATDLGSVNLSPAVHRSASRLPQQPTLSADILHDRSRLRELRVFLIINVGGSSTLCIWNLRDGYDLKHKTSTCRPRLRKGNSSDMRYKDVLVGRSQGWMA
ncbi:hypothetical protein Hypma_010419 [Hypsizygus marmoreus]|uniref:Uncharacterized protein n=1 Tax=Hypsizygus marmoreus TaxID=39966 RepID=A0A369JM50_HYPMA|nr:hypothetical protein Hypma_010419 [Hypsizygus marmoreus]